LIGEGLQERWRGRQRFVVCELGFGDGTRFLAAVDAWRRDADRPRRLDWLAVEPHPLARGALAGRPRHPALARDATELASQWPPPVEGRHRLVFDGGAVVLHLGFADAHPWLRATEATVDAFLLDGAMAGLDAALFRSMARLAADGARLVIRAASDAVCDGLAHAGFTIAQPGSGSGRGTAVAQFTWRGERDRPRSARSRAADRAPRTVAVIGAGLAGASAARALAEDGVEVVLVEAHGEVASGASAVAAGVFHAAVGSTRSEQAGAHARLARAASFEIARDARAAIDAGFASGRVDGVVRAAVGPVVRVRAVSDARSDPVDGTIDRLLDRAGALSATGIALADGGRWVRFAGVVEPRGLVRAWLASAGPRARLLLGRATDALRPDGDRWHVLDANGQTIVEADAVVVAAGIATPTLLAPWGAKHWQLRRVRGQTSRAPAGTWQGPAPRLPLTGHGHAFVDAGGGLVFGATAEPMAVDWVDEPLPVRPADHAFNVERLRRLLGEEISVRAEALEGSAGIRLVAPDRLPVVGAVPESLDGSGGPVRFEQPRHIPRVPGLFVCGAFGARGVLWSSLSGRLVAAAVTGGPAPVDSPLVDAVDPARFASRSVRRATVRASR
jgi:tRNA 5-methylaminomethyl-2-thiouridine biosynthesis bifunctional protein